MYNYTVDINRGKLPTNSNMISKIMFGLCLVVAANGICIPHCSSNYCCKEKKCIKKTSGRCKTPTILRKKGIVTLL